MILRPSSTLFPGQRIDCMATLHKASIAKGDYRLWVLAYDDVGNESDWSEPLPIFYDPVKPGKPVNQMIRR